MWATANSLAGLLNKHDHYRRVMDLCLTQAPGVPRLEEMSHSLEVAVSTALVDESNFIARHNLIESESASGC